MAKILDFKANNTTIGSGSNGLTNVIGPDWNVSRNSIANYIDDSDSLLKTAAANVPRIEGVKVLIEPLGTNFAWENSNIASASWNKDNVSWTPDTAISPDGTQNAGTGTKDDNLIWRTIFRTGGVDLTTNTTYIVSVYVKQGDGIEAGVQFKAGGLDLQAKVVFADDTMTERNWTGSWDEIGFDKLANGWYRVWGKATTDTDISGTTVGMVVDGGEVIGAYNYFWRPDIKEYQYTSMIETPSPQPETRQADVITNTVPNGTAPITMTTWIDGVSDGGQVVNQGDPITMVNGTTSIEIDDSAGGATTTVEIEWIDSISAAATGNKIYRDTVPSTGEVEIADIANGVQIYQDATAETGTEYKYEVQAHDGAGDETTREEEGTNMDYITTA